MSDSLADRLAPLGSAIRLLRLAQVVDVTGLGKTKIYELQAQEDFPMRVQITAHRVGWIEAEIQAWLARRAEARPRPRILSVDRRHAAGRAAGL